MSFSRITSKLDGMIRLFLLSVAFLLTITALAKLISATGRAGILSQYDPVFHFKQWQLLTFVGALEGIMAVVILTPGNPRAKLWLVAWLAFNFCLYRLALWGIGAPQPCRCLGNLADALKVPQAVVDAALRGVLAYLLIGSISLLILRKALIDRRKKEPELGVAAQES